MPGIFRGVSGTFWPPRHMPGIFSPHLQNVLSPEPDQTMGTHHVRQNQAYARDMPESGPKWVQSGQMGIYEAYAGHIFTAPPKCAKSRAGQGLWDPSPGIFGAFLLQFSCYRHMPGIFVTCVGKMGVSGICQAYFNRTSQNVLSPESGPILGPSSGIFGAYAWLFCNHATRQT